ncbi:MAG: hypothetical protein FJZ01_22045 [Candidatus Sericytochromatia bacterium]|nr:hypothetical protein [Candidatus Tanganyikabacteria bacterium]
MASAVRALGRDAFVSATPVKRDGKSDESQGSIAQDVAKIRIWPGADSPVVDAATDPRLADAGMTSRIVHWLDSKIALPIAEGSKWFTRTVGPGMFWVSGALNTYFLAKNWNDPNFHPAMKATLVAGTAATGAAATTATWAALPIKGALTANRFSGMFGGLAGGIFGALNMVVTLGDKQAMPVEKTFATAGFATGAAGTVFGTLAAFLPAGAALGPLGLGAWGMAFGLASLGLGLFQMGFGKNKTLNKAFSAVGNAAKKAWEGLESIF